MFWWIVEMGRVFHSPKGTEWQQWKLYLFRYLFHLSIDTMSISLSHISCIRTYLPTKTSGCLTPSQVGHLKHKAPGAVLISKAWPPLRPAVFCCTFVVQRICKSINFFGEKLVVATWARGRYLSMCFSVWQHARFHSWLKSFANSTLGWKSKLALAPTCKWNSVFPMKRFMRHQTWMILVVINFIMTD